MTGFWEVIGEIVGKILVIIEGVMDNWVTVVGINLQNWSPTAAGTAFTAELSDIVEKMVQICEKMLEVWFGVSPY